MHVPPKQNQFLLEWDFLLSFFYFYSKLVPSSPPLNGGRKQLWSESAFRCAHLLWNAFHDCHSGWEKNLSDHAPCWHFLFMAQNCAICSFCEMIQPFPPLIQLCSTEIAVFGCTGCNQFSNLALILPPLSLKPEVSSILTLHSVIVLFSLRLFRLFGYCHFPLFRYIFQLLVFSFIFELGCACLSYNLLFPNQIYCASFLPFKNSELYWIYVSLHLVLLPRQINPRHLSYSIEWSRCSGNGPPICKTFVLAMPLDWLGGNHSVFTL